MSEATLEGAGRKVHPSELNLYYRNPRVGNVDVIKGSLRAHSQYKPILVNKGTHTGRPNEVLAGNHTTKAIRDLAEEHPDDERWQSVDVWEIDVDDDRAARIVIADNRTAELGTTDDETLMELLSEMDDDLTGTGYEVDDLQELMDKLNESELGDGEGGEGEGEESTRAEDTGGLLALVDVTIGEPTAQPKQGEVYKLGRHTLVIAKLLDQHDQWRDFLKEDVLFAPYPEPYLTTTDLAQEKVLLMVQPNLYLAGHLIDKHNSAYPDQKAELQ